MAKSEWLPRGRELTNEEIKRLAAEIKAEVQAGYDRFKPTLDELEAIRREVELSNLDRHRIRGYTKEFHAGRKVVIKRCGGICEKCKKKPLRDVHHKLPIRFFAVRSDAHEPGNLMGLCRKCHLKEHRRLKKAMPLLDQILVYERRKLLE